MLFESYFLFLSKLVTFILLTLGGILLIAKSKHTPYAKHTLRLTHWNKQLNLWQETLQETKEEKSTRFSRKKKEKKKRLKQHRLFVIHFQGDIEASNVETLRHLITALLTTATSQDEILVNIDSKGGAVNAYGLAASQLARIRTQGIPLTVAIDSVAASGGYLMACVADKIIASPFAIVGSIGVIMQVPNFYEWLKKHHIKVEQVTAGPLKRDLTLFTENSQKDREHAKIQAERIHDSFQHYITQYRPQVDLAQVNTGEHWLAEQALSLNLVDKLQTSDTYLQKACQTKQVYLVTIDKKQTRLQKLKSQCMQAWQMLTTHP